MATSIGTYVTPANVKLAEGITDSDEDALLTLICDGVNKYIEDTTERVMAPINSATYLYDGGDPRWALEPEIQVRRTKLWLPVTADGARVGGFRSVSLVEIAAYTGQAFTTIPPNEYFLRTVSVPGGPFDYLQLSDYATIYRWFPVGFANVRVTGACGWAVIPDDIIEVARAVAIRAYHTAATGQQDASGTDASGAVHAPPPIAPFVTSRQNETLRAYKFVEGLV